jgi:hypothetical protein
MTKKLSFDRPNRRDFLRTGIIGGTGLVVAQFAAPKELRAQTNTWTGQVSASTDDAWEASLGYVNLADARDGICLQNTCAGFRFTNVTVPNEATITAASVSWYCENANPSVSEGCEVYMQASNSAPTFADTKFNIGERALTTHFGTFSDSTVTGWLSSSDISAAVQEVVNRAEWVSGNAMAVLTIATTATFGSPVTVRMWDFNNGGPPNYAAILTIQYT